MLRVELPSNSLLSGVVVCLCLKTFFPLFCMCVCLFLKKKKKKKNTPIIIIIIQVIAFNTILYIPDKCWRRLPLAMYS